MKSDKILNNKVREINLSGYWVKSRLDPLFPLFIYLFVVGSIPVRKYTPELVDSSRESIFSNSLLGPATAFPVQLDNSAVRNLFGSPKAKNIFKVAVANLLPYV